MKVFSTKLLTEEELKIAQQLQLEVTCKPTIQITCSKLNLNNIDDFDTVVFTSSNAINCFVENTQYVLLANKKIVCIAEKTASTLIEKNFSIYKSGNSIKEISAIINTDPNIGSILHPCGNLAKPLDTIKKYNRLEVYNNLPLYIEKISEEYNAILFFSPSGINGFIKNNTLNNNNTIYCCIGNSTATYLRSFNASLNIIIAEKTNAISMLQAIKNN